MHRHRWRTATVHPCNTGPTAKVSSITLPASAATHAARGHRYFARVVRLLIVASTTLAAGGGAVPGACSTARAGAVVYNQLLCTPTPQDVLDVKNSLAHDYNGGDWSLAPDGSLPKSNPTTYSVGYASGSDPSAQDAGLALAPDKTRIRPVLVGDANIDGTVDFFDLAQILGYKFNTHQPASYTDGDLNYDGVVDFFDIVLLLSANYNSGVHFDVAAPPNSDCVPLPSTPAAAIGLVGISLALAAMIRRRPLRRSD
jgi:hypothetical protein